MNLALGWRVSFYPTRRAAGHAMEMMRVSPVIRIGAISSSFTNISTEKQVGVSARITRPVGPHWGLATSQILRGREVEQYEVGGQRRMRNHSPQIVACTRSSARNKCLC